MTTQLSYSEWDKLHVPMIFQEQETYENKDTRFMKVKIWLCHTGRNLNGSFFDKPVIEQAIPSLANTPILAFIEENSKGEIDFSDHRVVISKQAGKFKFKYIGWAVGVIPESNNAHFEFRLCDDGIEREYLVVDGLVWQNKWTDAPNIFNRDLVKSQSMELDETSFKGFEDQDGYFHFTEFRFYGACCLGVDYQPAMVNSTIELSFTRNEFVMEMQSKIEEWKLLANHNQLTAFAADDDKDSNKEGGKMLMNEQTEIMNEVQEEITPEATFETQETSSPSDEDTEPVAKVAVDEPSETEFTEAVASETEESPESEPVQQFVDLETYTSLKTEYEAYKSEHITPETEVQALRQFKESRLAQDREIAVNQIFSQFADLEEIPEFQELKSDNANYELAELEDKCFTIRGKQVSVKFTKTQPERDIIPVEREDKNKAYGGIVERYAR